jgi:hypothetical protein
MNKDIDKRTFLNKRRRYNKSKIRKSLRRTQVTTDCQFTFKKFLDDNFHLCAILGIFGAFIFYLIQVISLNKKESLSQGCCNSYVNTTITNIVNISNVNFTSNLTTILPHIQDGNNITNNVNLTNNLTIILPRIQDSSSSCLGEVSGPNSTILFSNLFPILKTQPDIILQFLLIFSCFLFVGISLIILAQVIGYYKILRAPACNLIKFQLLFFQSILLIMIFLSLVFVWIEYSISMFAVLTLLFTALIMVGIFLIFLNFYSSGKGYLIVLLTAACLVIPLLIKSYILDSPLNPTDLQNLGDMISSWYAVQLIALGLAYSSFFGGMFILLTPFKKTIKDIQNKLLQRKTKRYRL